MAGCGAEPAGNDLAGVEVANLDLRALRRRIDACDESRRSWRVARRQLHGVRHMHEP